MNSNWKTIRTLMNKAAKKKRNWFQSTVFDASLCSPNFKNSKPKQKFDSNVTKHAVRCALCVLTYIFLYEKKKLFCFVFVVELCRFDDVLLTEQIISTRSIFIFSGQRFLSVDFYGVFLFLHIHLQMNRINNAGRLNLI